MDSKLNENEVISKLMEEVTHMKKVNENIALERDEYFDMKLIQEQINDDLKVKEKENECQWHERILELIQKLERKEYIMQTKEKKWHEVEKIMVEYARADMDLREKLAELRYICDDTSA